MTNHAYLLTAIISDKGPDFVFPVIKAVADELRIALEEAMTQRAQTIGTLERKHASNKKALKIETGE